MHAYNGKKLLLPWITANIAGFMVTFVLLALLDGFLGKQATSDVIGHIIVFVTGGILYGVFQWLALRSHLQLTPTYIIVNTLACTIGLIAGFIGGYIVAGPPMDFVGSPIMVGILCGIVQWLLLRRQLPLASLLFLASVGSFVLAALVGAIFLVAFADGLDLLVGSGTTGFLAIVITYSLLVGLIAGGVTGSVLKELLPRPLALAR